MDKDWSLSHPSWERAALPIDQQSGSGTEGWGGAQGWGGAGGGDGSVGLGGTGGAWSDPRRTRLTVGNGGNRERSSSKRRRGENGEVIDPVDRQPPRAKKVVVGTSGAQAGRKMRSPPADIFVYGVHPATTLQDIVEDLADSGIVIAESDITKRSKDEAFLRSYKISVKAEDLAKALDPAVWPLRVKVREYIYYSKRSQTNGGQHRQQGNSAGGPGQRQQEHGNAAGRQNQGQGQGGQEGTGADPNLISFNMFNVLDDEVHDGPGHTVYNKLQLYWVWDWGAEFHRYSVFIFKYTMYSRTFSSRQQG